MKTFKSQQEVDKATVDGVLSVDGDVTFDFENCIVSGNINARNIKAWDINARDINAVDINARDIKAGDINAVDISYYAVCFAYNNIVCKKIKGRRENAKHFCLDGKITLQDA